METNVESDDLFGVIFLKIKGANTHDVSSYFDALKVTIQALNDSRLENIMTGFYLNCIDNFVRFSYFTRQSDSLGKLMYVFTEYGLEEGRNHQEPDAKDIAEKYGGTGFEKRFRRFLVQYTTIAIELFHDNLIETKKKLLRYALEVRRKTWTLEQELYSNARKYLEPVFIQSTTYSKYDEKTKREFFIGFSAKPDPTNYDWGHFMIDCMLGDDPRPKNLLTEHEIEQEFTKYGLSV